MSAVFTDTNFEELVIQSPRPSVIDFWATWCPPCVALGPTIDALAREFEGAVNVGKINVDENPGISIAYGVTNLPCVLFLVNGQVVDKQVGAAPKAVYQQKLLKLLDTFTPPAS